MSGITYGPAGEMTQTTFGNGLTNTRVYNSRLQPCRINVNSSSTALTSCTGSAPSGNVQDFHYGFNAGSSDNGNVVSWNASGQQAFTRSYTYDALNRLSGLSDTTSGNSCNGLSWGYDSWGNRTAQSITSGGSSCGTWSASYSTANKITNTNFNYDAAGNLIHDGSYTYFYDAENRLIQMGGTLGTCSTAMGCYFYDAEGRRTEKIAGSNIVDFIYDNDERVLAEFIPSNWMTGYAYVNGQLVSITAVRLKVEENQLVDVFDEICVRVDDLESA